MKRLDELPADDPFAISVVLVNWHGKDVTLRCLRSLGAQTDPDFAVIIVDNGSTDGSVEATRAEFPAVTVIEAGENLGFAEGCNRGIAATRTAWVSTLNNDTVVDPRWIAELRKAAHEADDTVGMLQCHVLFLDDDEHLNSTGVLLYSNGSAEDRDVRRSDRATKAPPEVFCATAGAAVYRRAALDRIRLESGFFDRTFFMYFEDVDIGWRFRLAGFGARYVRTAIVRHAFQASSKKREGKFIGIHLRRNRLRMILKNGSVCFVAKTMPKSLYEICELVVWEGPKIVPSVARAALDGIRQRPEVTRATGATDESRRLLEERWVSRSPDSLRREILHQLTKPFRRKRA